MARRVQSLVLLGALSLFVAEIASGTTQEGAPGKVVSSPAKRAYADALVQALETYQRETRAHKDADPLSRWEPFPGHGYRLSARTASDVFLVAQPAVRGKGPAFGVAMELGRGGCGANPKPTTQDIDVDGWKAWFKGHCTDGLVVYLPMRDGDAKAFRRLVETSSSVTVTALGRRASFDLSSVPVVEAKVALDALGPPPE